MADFAYVFLPLSAVFAWWFSKQLMVFTRPKKKTKLSNEYYAGLNFLLNEETDKAIESFIKLLDTTHDSVETTLSIGCFFRRRGEVDRAIRLHQNLIAKPNLTSQQRYAALLELAQDYMCAGVYDRAELLLIEITQADNIKLKTALKNLLVIYEREKEWEKAIDIAFKIQNLTGECMKVSISQYYCELADNYWQKGKVAQAFKYLKKGQYNHRKSVRILLQRGEYEMKMGHLKNALKLFKEVEYVDNAFLSTAVKQTIQCYQKMHDEENLYLYLRELSTRTNKLDIILAFAQAEEKRSGTEQAQKIMMQHLERYPSLKGLSIIIDFTLSCNENGREFTPLQLAKSTITKLCKSEYHYMCSSCGLELQALYWQCPSCRHWERVKPH